MISAVCIHICEKSNLISEYFPTRSSTKLRRIIIHSVAAGLIGIPVDTENPERTAMVAEALAYYSYEYVRPAIL